MLRPHVERYETLFSAPDRAEGIAVLAEAMSDVVMEHAYWGGARDRIPASQTDAMAPLGEPELLRDGALVTVRGHEHLCLIRSGQDWSDTEAEERRMYLEDVEPVLRAGMDFLRDDGRAIGCFANRYARGRDRRRTADREELRHELVAEPGRAGALGRVASDPRRDLRRGDEVPVDARPGREAEAVPRGDAWPRADEQLFEYLGCHDRTGLLRAG